MSIPTPDHNVTKDNQQQPSGDGQRTPRTEKALAWVGGNAPAPVIDVMRELERELNEARSTNNALRARVAELEECKVSDFEIFHGARVKITELCGDPYLLHTEGLEKIGKDLADLRAQLKEATERADALRRECERLARPCGWPDCEPAKVSIEKLRAAVWNGDQNLNALTTARAELAKLKEECEQAREKQKELNRRCQHAESVIAKSGIAEEREQGPKNRSLGRALANYAAAQAYRERDEARAELEKWRDCAGKLAEALKVWKGICDEIDAGYPKQVDSALTAYRALAGEGAGK